MLRGRSLPSRLPLRLLTALLCIAPPAGAAQEERAPLREESIKAAFFVQFAYYVDWPAATWPPADAPIRVGVLSADGFADVVARELKGRKVKDRGFSVERSDDPAALRACHLVYVPRLGREREKQILASWKGAPLLSVGDTEDFASRGGVFNFTLEERRVRLLVNTAAADRAGLKINSKLLQLFKVVPEIESP